MRRSVDVEVPLEVAKAADLENHGNCSGNEKHRCVEAGVAVELAVAWPADAVKLVLYRPLGHCHRTMSHFVLIALIL